MLATTPAGFAAPDAPDAVVFRQPCLQPLALWRSTVARELSCAQARIRWRRRYALCSNIHFITVLRTRSQQRGFVPECAPNAGATGEQVAPASAPRAAAALSRASCAAYSAPAAGRVIQCGRFSGQHDEGAALLQRTCWSAGRRFSSSVSACKLASNCCNCSSANRATRRWPALLNFSGRDGLIYVFKYLCGDLPVNLSAGELLRSSARSFFGVKKAANCPCDNSASNGWRRSPAGQRGDHLQFILYLIGKRSFPS